MKDKRYLKGSAREVTFSNGGSLLNLSLNVAELQALANEKGWVNISVAERREKDQYDNTHSVYYNDFVPDKTNKKSQPAKAKQSTKDEDGLPF